MKEVMVLGAVKLSLSVIRDNWRGCDVHCPSGLQSLGSQQRLLDWHLAASSGHIGTGRRVVECTVTTVGRCSQQYHYLSACEGIKPRDPLLTFPPAQSALAERH